MPRTSTEVNIFANAAARNGPVHAGCDARRTRRGLNLTAIAVDSAGNGYIVDVDDNAVYGYDNIATAQRHHRARPYADRVRTRCWSRRSACSCRSSGGSRMH